MLTLVVTRLEDRPLESPMRAEFGALGGTIGRMGTNTLILPDLEGRVAPLQARIKASPEGYAIRNCSASPLQVNGVPIANHSEAMLAEGDEIVIGAYTVRVVRADAEDSAHGADGSTVPTAQPSSSSLEGAAGGVDSDAGGMPDSHEELERAFLEGLGMPDLALPGGLNAEFMERLGALMRQVTEGTIDLLRIRSETKSSVHAGVTMIDSRAVNPFKAAWDADVALQQLLAPQRSDILGPLEAMADAYHDLHIHDRGLVAGIHAALAGLLERFKPAELEKRLAVGRGLEQLLPAAGKSRRWDLLVELYGELSVEAQQDFWAVFEKEFLEAYAAGRRSRNASGTDRNITRG